MASDLVSGADAPQTAPDAPAEDEPVYEGRFLSEEATYARGGAVLVSDSIRSQTLRPRLPDRPVRALQVSQLPPASTQAAEKMTDTSADAQDLLTARAIRIPRIPGKLSLSPL